MVKFTKNIYYIVKLLNDKICNHVKNNNKQNEKIYKNNKNLGLFAVGT